MAIYVRLLMESMGAKLKFDYFHTPSRLTRYRAVKLSIVLVGDVDCLNRLVLLPSFVDA